MLLLTLFRIQYIKITVFFGSTNGQLLYGDRELPNEKICFLKISEKKFNNIKQKKRNNSNKKHIQKSKIKKEKHT